MIISLAPGAFLLADTLKPTIKGNTVIYHLSIDEKIVNFSGKESRAIAVNDRIPAPTLTFTEGENAVIYVANQMEVETSIHWHGILLPNLQDGVPYLTTPPILPKSTYRYEFPLKHSGTYWYHSHTGLQEQRGVYGAIVIKPRNSPQIKYDRELTVVLSDWTDEDPLSVMKNLKRHNEWYAIKKGTTQPLINSMRKGLLGARWTLFRYRMPDMHISDVYYDAFLSNGKRVREYPEFKANERIRLRLINAAASTYFWITSAQHLQVIAADGVDVDPAHKDKILMAIGETYDFLLTVPKANSVEVKASAHDGSGSTSFFIGRGRRLHAPNIPKPDYFQLMKKVADLHKGGGHSRHYQKPYVKIIESPPDDNKIHLPVKERQNDEEHHKKHAKQNDKKYQKGDGRGSPDGDPPDGGHHQGHHHGEEANLTTDFNYDFLKAKEKSAIQGQKRKKTREILLNLTANMLRYVWSINNKVLSKEDKIHIKKGEVVRLILNNNTMMHHPMHLHGHFFRVINKNKEYSPWKHSVDIPPFESVTIEFSANEEGDWFFHCHILYHMMAGMARVFSYDTPRHPALAPYPYDAIFHHDQQFFHWAKATAASNMAALEYTASNTDNAVMVELEYGWNQNYESEIRYERYLSNFLRWSLGANAENEESDRLEENDIAAFTGIRYQLLSILDFDARLDHKVRPQIGLDGHVFLWPKVMFYSELEWQSAPLRSTSADSEEKEQESEYTVQFGLEYILDQNFSLNVNYDNRFHLGAGLTLLF